MSQNILHLTLKKQWYDMTYSGIKKEEYREIKPYWVSRLAIRHDGAIGGDFMDKHKPIAYVFKKFTHTQLTNGYSKTSPSFTIEQLHIRIGRGNPEWGAPTDTDVFIISHGSIITN